MKKNIVQMIVNKIEDRINLNKSIDLNEVENLSGYSVRYIQEIFKDVTGVSVSKYIKKRVLTRGAILLKMTKKSISHIAMDLNFSSQQTFTRSFSREFKISPLKFRRQRYFDCSYLMPSFMINPYTYKVYQTYLSPLKLVGHNFLLKEGLLEKKVPRANKIRLREISKIIKHHKQAFIMTTFSSQSTLASEVYLKTFIGYECNRAGLEVIIGDCWAVDFVGAWRDYVTFGRLLTLYMKIKVGQVILEKITLSYKNDTGEQIYHITSFIPLLIR
ncbi:helix-turn-helix domain-containing protein [Escherichia coli]|nr:helix-turn-helix domain-containing protein [Escherichia coli]EFK5292319.1 helix-turn-helix domain-containing protein [Escherichia coli]